MGASDCRLDALQGYCEPSDGIVDVDPGLAAANSGPEATTLVDTTLGPQSWDVTATTQALVDAPTGDHGFVLNADPAALADADRAFASNEAADAALRPALTITYIP